MQMSYRGDKKVIFCKYTDIVIWNGIKLYLAVSTLAENKGNHHRTSRHDILNLVQAFSQSLNTPINGKVHDNQHFQVFIVLCTLTKLFMCVWAYYPAAVWIILHKDAKMREACRSRMECFFFVRVHSFWWCYPTVFDTPWTFQILYLEWNVLKCWYCGQFGLHALYTSGAASTVFLSSLLPRNMTVTVRKSLGIRKAQHEFELLCLDVLLWCNIQLLSKQCSDGNVRESNSYKRCTMASDWLK